MRRRFHVSQALDHIIADEGSEDRQMSSFLRRAMMWSITLRHLSDREVTGAEADPADTFTPKSGNIC